MLQICPKLHDQQFEELPFKEEILTFLRDLVINKCLSGKGTGYDSLRLSQAQILWGMYYKKNIDYAYLLWEEFVYQVETKNVKRSNEMYYPRFTKVIVNFFMTKDQSIPRRNKINWHFSMDDHMFTTIKVVSRHEDTQLYGAILPNELTNEDIRNSESFKEYYAIASGAEPPKIKASVKKKQKKQPAKTSKAKGLTVLSEVALTESEQIKLATKRSLIQTHSSHASGSGADKGTGSIPGVPDVPTYESDDEQISWKSSEEDDDDEVNVSEENDNDNNDDDQDDEGQDDVNKQTNSDNDGDDLVHPKFSTHDDEARQDEEVNEEDSFDPRVHTPSHVNLLMMKKVMKKLKSDRLREEAQAENENFINTLDDNIKKIIKEQVKKQVKAQVTKILPKIKKTVNEQLEVEVLTRSSNESKTSYKNLYKALVDAYKSDKLILNTYGDTVPFKRRRDDEDKDEKPSVRSNRESKRRRARKEPESTSAPKEKTSKTTGKSTAGSKSHHKIMQGKGANRISRAELLRIQVISIRTEDDLFSHEQGSRDGRRSLAETGVTQRTIGARARISKRATLKWTRIGVYLISGVPKQLLWYGRYTEGLTYRQRKDSERHLGESTLGDTGEDARDAEDVPERLETRERSFAVSYKASKRPGLCANN
ncbi:hypothetical protein Tco_0278145 [Tanacetum coccineum]